MRRFEDRVVIVTGAAGGIGLAAARAFASEGAQVVLTDLDAERVAAAVGGIEAEGGRATGLVGDVSDAQQVGAQADEVVRQFGRIDVLVNNAGIMRRAPAEQLSVDDWRRVMAVNLDACFYWAQAAASRSMIPRRRGAIVNVASMAGMAGIPIAAAYVASKHGVVGLTKALAIDWAQYGIRINALCPGFTVTELSKDDRAKHPQMFVERAERVPLGHAAEPADQASAILYLASDEARYVHGLVMNVDGGQIALSSGHSTPR